MTVPEQAVARNERVARVLDGLSAAIRDDECPIQFSPLLMEARKLLSGELAPVPQSLVVVQRPEDVARVKGFNTVSNARLAVKLRDYKDTLAAEIGSSIEARIKTGSEDVYGIGREIVDGEFVSSLITAALSVLALPHTGQPQEGALRPRADHCPACGEYMPPHARHMCANWPPATPQPDSTCPKCRRTRHDWDCAEDDCPMAAAPQEGAPVAVMTASAQATALRWLDASIERANQLARTVSGEGEHAEIFTTLRAMLSHVPQAGCAKEGWREELEQADGCFEAAYVEGLAERLAEGPGDVGSLVDLVRRRILLARTHIQRALSASPPPPVAESGKRATMLMPGIDEYMEDNGQ